MKAKRKYNRIIVHTDGSLTSPRGKPIMSTDEIARDAKFYDIKKGIAILRKR
jgi:hypothetical protein